MKKVEKKCNFLHIRARPYISHFLGWFWAKSENFLGNKHFSPNFLKKSAIFCNFCAENISGWDLGSSYICPILEVLFGEKVLKIGVKVGFYPDFTKKSAIFCNFLQFSIQPLLHTFHHEIWKKFNFYLFYFICFILFNHTNRS